MEESNHRIAYALYMMGKWVYGKDDKDVLERKGIPVTPEEFDLSMKRINLTVHGNLKFMVSRTAKEILQATTWLTQPLHLLQKIPDKPLLLAPRNHHRAF